MSAPDGETTVTPPEALLAAPPSEPAPTPALDDPRRPSTSARVDELEKQVKGLETKVLNLAKFMASFLAQQMQPQAMARMEAEIQENLLRQISNPNLGENPNLPNLG